MEREESSEGCRPVRQVRAMRIVGIVIAGIIFATLFALLFGWLVMLLWNWLMPSIFGLGAITYWKAFGVTVLAKILFGGMCGGRHGGTRHHRSERRWRRWVGSDDGVSRDGEFGKFTHEEMRHYGDFWKEHGEQAFADYLRKVRGGKKEER